MTISMADKLPDEISDIKLRDLEWFAECFWIYVDSQGELDSKKAAGQLPTTSEINDELTHLKGVAKRLLRALHGLREDTRRLLDAEHINDGFPLDIDDSKPKFEDFLEGVLSRLQVYCEQAKQMEAQPTNSRTKVESMLMERFEEAGGKVTQSDNGPFAKVLRAFREACGHEDTVSAIYIRRLLERRARSL